MSNIYETPALLDQYLLFHYGSADEVMPEGLALIDPLPFPVRTVVENVPSRAFERALDLGCAVGRSSFELSALAHEVTGLDFSHAFVDAAQRLQRGETLTYRRHEEGFRSTELHARRPERARPERIVFMQGDAMALPGEWGGFDLVHAANLLCRLSEPTRLLTRLPSLVRPGGCLILTTPCTWLGEFTKPEHWPTGTTLDWLKDWLHHDFSLQTVRDQPFVIREHARKYQWSVAQASVWLRK